MKTAIELLSAAIELLKKTEPDPYAALRAAHAAGKVIQYKTVLGWEDVNPAWGFAVESYRIKPEPAWTLPTPPDGRQWHRTDWEADMLPDGWRPLLEGEQIHPDDGYKSRYSPEFLRNGGKEGKTGVAGDRKYEELDAYFRTRRPLPHRWQREREAMERGEKVEVRWRNGGSWGSMQTRYPAWDDPQWEFRIAPKPSLVPWDCPEDVPGPVCWVRCQGAIGWSLITGVSPLCVSLTRMDYTWGVIAQNNWEYSTDRKAWHPCTKEASK